MPLVLSLALNDKIMLRQNRVLIEQQCFGCDSCSSFGHTEPPSSCTSTFLCDLQHAPSSKSTQIHDLLAQPSAPQAGRQKQKHDPSATDLCLTWLGPCHFWGETSTGQRRQAVHGHKKIGVLILDSHRGVIYLRDLCSPLDLRQERVWFFGAEKLKSLALRIWPF